MAEWWASINVLEQGFMIIALPATLILLIQTILLIFGGHTGAPDTDLDSDITGIGDNADISGSDDIDFPDSDSADLADSGLRLFSIRGIITFMVVCGWSGVVFIEIGLHDALAIILSLVLGFAALYGMAKLMQAMMKLQENGMPDYRKALGKNAQVYLTIPAAGSGQGKINLVLGESLGEFTAVTYDKKPIRSGEMVRVIDLAGGVYVVEREQ